MREDQYMKLFKYMEGRFDAIDARLDDTALKSDVENLRNTVVDFAGRVDGYAQEMAFMQHKMDRLERYIQVLADKAGVDLESIKV